MGKFEKSFSFDGKGEGQRWVGGRSRENYGNKNNSYNVSLIYARASDTAAEITRNPPFPV